MKDFRTMKRQRGRSRKSGGSSTHNPNRAYESNGPEGVKVRGNAQTIYEKYQQLARDANSAGDRVLAEGFLQHAEHYFRLIRMMQPQRPVTEFVQRDPFSSGFDDFDEEMFPENADSQEVSSDEGRENYRENYSENRNDNRSDNRHNDRDNRHDRYNNNRNRDRERDYQSRDNRERDPNQREHQDRERNDGNRRETRRERYDRLRQQRNADNLESVTNSFQPQAEPSAPAFIASTQPLAPSKPAEPPVISDADALPDFIRRQTPLDSETKIEAVDKEQKTTRTTKTTKTTTSKAPRRPARSKKPEAEVSEVES